MESTAPQQVVVPKKSAPLVLVILLLLVFFLGAGGVVYTYIITPVRDSKNLSESQPFNPDDPFFQQLALADTTFYTQQFRSTKINLAFTYNASKWMLSEWPLNVTLINKTKTEDRKDLVYETVVISTFALPKFNGANLTALKKYFESTIQPDLLSRKQLSIDKVYTTTIGNEDIYVAEYTYPDFSNNMIYAKDYFWLVGGGQGYRLLYSLPQLSATHIEEIETILASIKPTSSPFDKPQVRGTSTVIDDGERMVIENKPSVVRIFKRVCGELSSNKSQSSSLQGKKYHYCAAGWGSGFFVNHEGYIATNGHVAVIPKEEAVFDSIYSGYSYDFLKDILRDAVRVYLTQKYGNAASEIPDTLIDQQTDEYIKNKFLSDPEALTSIASAAVSDIKNGNLSAQNQTDETYIQNTEEPILLNTDGSVKNPDHFLKAEIVGYDYESRLIARDAEKFNTSDVAILKVKPDEYPSVTLGDSTTLELGTPVYVIGYPGVSTDIKLLDDSSKIQQTITRGIVSAFKEAAGNKKKLIQIDASISGGNSGGPAFTKNGDVVGIATYKILTESADFNFLRDVADLKQLMEKQSVTNTQGPVSLQWKAGLDNYGKKYYQRALINFKEVQSLYAQHPDVGKFIDQTNSKIAAGDDVTPLFTLLNHDYGKFETTVMGISVGIMVVSGILLLAVLLRSKSKQAAFFPNKSKAAYTNPYMTVKQVPPLPPVARVNPPVFNQNLTPTVAQPIQPQQTTSYPAQQSATTTNPVSNSTISNLPPQPL